MTGFWGRAGELARLDADLDQVARRGRGMMVAVRGRRQSGKSRLLTEFVQRADVPYLFTTAVKNAVPAVQLAAVMADLDSSRVPLPQQADAFAAPATTWADLFARLPLAIGNGPAIVVLDEFPWATESDDTLEGVLQNAWDRSLENLPVLLVVVGSDLAMMERLTEYDRPLYGRATERTIAPLSPADVAEACGTDRDPVDLLDVYLATGGYPRLVTDAARHKTAERFVHAQLQDDSSPLLVVGQRVLSSEFPDADAVQTVLEAIGSVEVGHATFSDAVAHLGDTGAASAQVTRSLKPLQDKKMVTIEVPIGAPAKSRLRRYRIADPYLRFWFRFCQPELANIGRGRSDLALARFDRDHGSWRGRAIEPVVHGAINRLATDRLATDSGALFADVAHVGSWWNRTNSHEFDVAAASRKGQVRWVGSIKWRAGRPMKTSDVVDLAAARGIVPDAAGAKLLAVCPAGAEADTGFDRVLDAGHVLDAYR